MFEGVVATFLGQTGGGLAARYAAGRRTAGVPVALPEGPVLALSPGGHNQLQAQVIHEFLPRFAKGARVLYLGDTDHKSLHVEEAALASLGVPVTKHDKLPDIVLHDERRGWLFLIEAVTTHGPVSAKRHMELEAMLRDCKAGRVYVSAFPGFKEFKLYASSIAWETEVWLAEVPEHLLHYNGDRFFGPR
ncbi:MAG: BsuBI/PstI family type II restriction endonuclease [Minicystis sp.]